MKKTAVILVFIIALLTLLSCIPQNNEQNDDSASDESTNEQEDIEPEIGLDVGNIAPDFTFSYPDGTEKTLSDLEGYKVLLQFWATWCPSCVKELPAIEAIYAENSLDIAFLLVPVNNAEFEVNSFITQKGYTFPIAFDKNGEIAKLYKISSIPMTYIIDEEGIIESKMLGYRTEEQFRTALGLD